MSLLKLTDIKTPTLPLELPDGTRREFDLYELGERIDALSAAEREEAERRDIPSVPAAEHYDGLRGVFEFPPKAQADKDGAYTLTRAQCETLQTEVLERISKLPEKQRFFALLRSLSELGSSPAK